MVDTESIHLEELENEQYRQVYELSNGCETVFRIDKEEFEKLKRIYPALKSKRNPEARH